MGNNLAAKASKAQDKHSIRCRDLVDSELNVYPFFFLPVWCTVESHTYSCSLKRFTVGSAIATDEENSSYVPRPSFTHQTLMPRLPLSFFLLLPGPLTQFKSK